jgi:alpha-tubulin suppressor-like RCC1 family protein
VKPENIFLDATSGRAMLSDFGVARVMDAPTELTATGTTIGTPTYMAPEQIDGIHLDGRSDLYSLGMVGWEMLTGERPWAGESLYSVIYRQKHDQLPPIDTFREDVPARTQYLIEGLMPKNPDRRWASAARFLTLLASDQPPPGFKDWESAQRRRRRARVFQQARQRGDSVIGAALETVKFSRPPTPVAALASGAERKTPVAPAPDEQYFEPTGEAATAKFARQTTPAGVGVAAMLNAGVVRAHSTPSGGFSIQRPAHEANTRLSPNVLIPPRRSRFVRFSIIMAGAAALTVLAWIQFGPARAAEVQFDPPNIPRDDRAIDVPVVTPPADSLAQRATDSTLAAARDTSVVAQSQPLSPTTVQPNARFGGIRSTADSGRLAAMPPLSGVRTTPRPDSTPRPEVTTAPPPATPPAPAVAFRKDPYMIAAGRGHSCVLSDGRAACWGSNSDGQLGDGSQDSRSEPGLVAGDFAFLQIAAGWNYTCGLTTGSEVVCWGANATGQLGDGTTQPRSAPVRINSQASFRLIRTARDHTCGLSGSYAVICWGKNDEGQLGDGTKLRRNSPVMVELPVSVADVTVGFAHTCALTVDGAAWCWGRNDDGQLGDGYASSRSEPTRVKFDGQFVSISAGAYHTCAVTAAGGAWCWGRNAQGQLGFAGASVSTPHLVSGAPAFSTISAGFTFTCARGKDSSAWCWGLNNYGQLGDGTLSPRPVPTQVKGLSFRLASLNAGSGHVCAVTDRAEAYCWGSNVDGQIGRVDRDGSPSPVRILVPPR